MKTDFKEIRQSVSLIDVVARYVELKKSGSEFKGLCPFHDDSDPSLTLFRGFDGAYRYHCFACEASGDVVDFLANIENISVQEAVQKLVGNDLPAVGTYKIPEKAPDESKCWVPIMPVPDDAPPYDVAKTFNPKRGRVVDWSHMVERVDPYLDKDGNLSFYVARLKIDEKKKACPVVTYCEGPGGERRWTSLRPKPPYPLQGLDQLAKRKDDWVLITSGEKCRAVAEKEVGDWFVCVTWLGGDKAVSKADIGPLLGRKIYLWPDADLSGKRGVKMMKEMIEKSGTG